MTKLHLEWDSKFDGVHRSLDTVVSSDSEKAILALLTNENLGAKAVTVHKEHLDVKWSLSNV